MSFIAHPVICFYCKKRFDRDKEPTEQISTRRYAHKECYEKEHEKELKENADKQKLFEYLQQKFGKEVNHNTKILKQLKTYVEENKFTYSGIHKTLFYFYDIKKNSIDKANNGIGIVPYVYQEALRYYYHIWEAQQRNKDKEINLYVPTVEEVHILRPQRKVKKRKYFEFLDKD